MTQNTKVPGKFYPLQHSEWLKACHELTPAQRDVLYYLRTLDPYGNGLEINCAEIARELSSDRKQIHRQTVSRAVKELDKRGFINADILTCKVVIKSRGLWCDETPGCDETPSVIMTHQSGSSRTTSDHDAPQRIVTHHAASETLTQQEPCNSKIYKTYKDFKDSLSDSEREKFLEFGQKKAAELPKPPTLPEKWVENHHLELYEQFKKTPLGKNLPPTKDWANHPQRDSWIAQMREKGEWAFILQAPKEDQPERRAFHDWADANNLIWPELDNRESQVC